MPRGGKRKGGGGGRRGGEEYPSSRRRQKKREAITKGDPEYKNLTEQLRGQGLKLKDVPGDGYIYTSYSLPPLKYRVVAQMIRLWPILHSLTSSLANTAY